MELILASGSARRRQILQNMGYEFTVIPCTMEEKVPEGLSPWAVVERLARMKARTVFDSLPEERRGSAAVLGSDTLVTIGDTVLGKPGSRAEAVSMLREESGRVNTVLTGAALITAAGESVVTDSAQVMFEELTDDEIEAYVATGEPMDKAGAYGIQGLSSLFIRGIRGSYFTVVGLPVHIVYRMLKGVGILPLKFQKTE